MIHKKEEEDDDDDIVDDNIFVFLTFLMVTEYFMDNMEYDLRKCSSTKVIHTEY